MFSPPVRAPMADSMASSAWRRASLTAEISTMAKGYSARNGFGGSAGMMRQQQHRTDGQLGQAAVPPPGGGLFPLAPGRRRRRPAPPGGPRSVCHSAFPLLEQCMPPAAGIEPKNASRCIRPMAKCPRMACNRATMNAGGAAMSGIMQRRPITLYETLEALYQQVNAPFCAQRRPQRPALGGAGPGPGAYRPAGGAAAPGGGHGPAGAGGPGRSVGPGG